MARLRRNQSPPRVPLALNPRTRPQPVFRHDQYVEKGNAHDIDLYYPTVDCRVGVFCPKNGGTVCERI